MRRRAWILTLLGCAAAACGRAPRPATTDAAPPTDAVAVDAAPPRAVLFVGNSYTYYFELPVEVAALAAPAAPLITTSVTVGGAALRDHWNGEARAAIAAGGHAIVVLQGQSQEPLLDAAGFAAHADLLAAAATSAGAEVVFYQTWARRAGDAFYADPASGGTPAAMQDGLTAGYAGAAARATRPGWPRSARRAAWRWPRRPRSSCSIPTAATPAPPARTWPRRCWSRR